MTYFGKSQHFDVKTRLFSIVSKPFKLLLPLRLCLCCCDLTWRCGCWWFISCFWQYCFCWKFDMRFLLSSYLLLLTCIAYVLRQWLHWRKQEPMSFRQNDAWPLGKSKSCLCTNGQSVREGKKRTGRLLGVFSVSENGWKWALSNLTKKCFYLPLSYALEILIWPPPSQQPRVKQFSFE